MRIGLDIDGVVANWEAYARELLNDQFGVSLQVSTEWDSIRKAVSPKQWKWLWSDALDDLFSYPLPYHGARDGVAELRKIGDVVIITSVPKAAIPARLYWLINQHDIVFDEFRVVNGMSDKSKILPLCDVYIDDSSEVAVDILKNTHAKMILWDRPWNSGVNSPNTILTYSRVNEWCEVLDIIRSIA